MIFKARKNIIQNENGGRVLPIPFVNIKALPLQISNWELLTINILQYTVIGSIFASLPLVLRAKKTFLFSFFKRFFFFIALFSYILLVAFAKAVNFAPEIGWNRAIWLMGLAGINVAVFFMVLCKLVPLIVKKKKAGWHWIWIPFYIVSFFSMTFLEKV